MFKHLNTFIRYTKAFFYINLKNHLEHKEYFWLLFFILPFWSLMQIIFIETIFQQTTSFIGYSKYEMYILFGTYRIVDGFCLTVIVPRISRLSLLLRGDDNQHFDAILTKPIDSQLFATFGYLYLGGISSMLVGAAVAIYGFIHSAISLAHINIIMYVLTMMLGVFMFYIGSLSLRILVFWFEDLQATKEIWDSVKGLAHRPTGLYQGIYGLIINLVFPIALMGAIPADILLGKKNYSMFFLYLVIIAVLFYLLRRVWFLALKQYSSFSS